MNMKKKLTISVADLLNKNHSQHPHSTKNDHKHTIPQNEETALHHAQGPLSFQEMYKQIMKKASQGQATPKYVYESKKVTPMNTQRIKKGIINSVLASNSQKTNKTAAPRMLNPKSGNSSTNQSWRNTPENKNRKNSINSIVMNKENIKNNSEEPTPEEFKVATGSVKNLRSKRMSMEENKKRVQQQQNILVIFDRLVKEQLHHENHSHLRKDECFLGESEVYSILSKLGYDIDHKLTPEILNLLEVDIYGGTPSQNFRKLISIIQGVQQEKNICIHAEVKLPQKIINNNLQLVVSNQEQIAILKYFSSFKLTRSSPLKSSIKTYSRHNSLEKDSQRRKQSQQQSAQKQSKFMHLPLAELMENLNRSSDKKNQEKEKQPHFEEKSLGISRKVQEIQGMNLNTFRKKTESDAPSSPISKGEEKLYSPHSIVSSEKKRIEQQDNGNEDIVALKNRLNQALRKSSSLASELSDLAEQNQNTWQLPTYNKYGSKPILSVDVNLGQGISQKIIVYEGETAKIVSDRLAAKFTISEETRLKFEKMLQAHLSTMLWKIDEVSQEMLTDRDLD